jgi:V8-like Glu-specific endopeptidase
MRVSRPSKLAIVSAVLATAGLSSALRAAPNWPTEPPAFDDLGDPIPFTPTPKAQRVITAIDSGPVLEGASALPGRQLRWSTDLVAPGADWVRVVFDAVELSGDPNAENGAMLRVVSLADGDVQTLNAESLAQWSNTSCYFNGESVRIELWSDPAAGPSRVRVAGLYADDPAARPIALRSLCGADDRVRSFDNRAARLSMGCTGWMFNDRNRQFLTAGHCNPSGTTVVSFNVPLSSSTGSLNAAPANDQYPVDGTSVQLLNSGVGSDWAYFAALPNANTGLLPNQAYGMNYNLATVAPTANGRIIRITGYGTNAAPADRTLNQAQTTHADALQSVSTTFLRYIPDTTGGNSGSAVLDEAANLAVGIHTHAGCTSGGNQGTLITRTDLQAALSNPLGVARSGTGIVGGSLFAIGDLNNNFGTVTPAPGRFARIAAVGARWQGMAYQPQEDRFLAINPSRQLFAINPVSGAATLLGTVSGTTQTLTGLGFDPGSQRLYAMTTTTGQLVSIDLGTFATTNIGAASGAGVRALEFDASNSTLYGLLTTGSGTTATVQLVSFDQATGARTIIGIVGAGLTSAADLAVSPTDNTLRTINPATGDLISINRSTGAGTSLGSTSGRFGAAFGTATRISITGTCCVGTTCSVSTQTNCAGSFGAIGSTCQGTVENPITCCRANFNATGGVTTLDIFDFLSTWFTGNLASDFNQNGSLSVQDIFDFLEAWFAGC